MKYYNKHNGKVELTLNGQYVLTFLGLTISDLRRMTSQQLIDYVIKTGRALDTGKTTKSSAVGFKNVGWKHSGNTKEKMTKLEYQQAYNDIGEASRFFDLDAWSRHHGFLDVPKASKQERDMGLYKIGIKEKKGFNASPRDYDGKVHNIIKIKNVHPTVKPLKLMAYLIELGCPSDGVVLDPFVGSGTTCLAAQKLGRRWIGIEINSEYVEIARRRIASLPKTLTSFV